MHDFDTVIEPAGEGRYLTRCLRLVHQQYPNGGYIMGVLTRAMARTAACRPEAPL